MSQNNGFPLPFTDDQMALAAFQLSIENNALLRVLLGNQLDIMERLEIEPRLNENIYSELMTSYKYDNKNPIQISLRGAEDIAVLIEKRVWEWSALNVNIKLVCRGEDPYQSMHDEE